MPFTYLESSLCTGFQRDHCALCRTTLESVLREVPCPHWFVTPGPRGFRIERLIPVFEIFDVDAIIDFLRILASSARIREFALPFRQWQDDTIKRSAINWRNRGWLFEQHVSPCGAPGDPAQFVLSTFFDGALMEKARVELDPRERTVIVTVLVSRRRDPAVANARVAPALA